MVRRKAVFVPQGKSKRPRRSDSFDVEGEASNDDSDPFEIHSDMSGDEQATTSGSPSSSATMTNEGNDREVSEDRESAKKEETNKGGGKEETLQKESVPDEVEMETDATIRENEEELDDDEIDENLEERVVEDLLDVIIPPLKKPVMNSDGTGSRLMITKVVNENFKSYYGRHEIGPFHQNFTSIVGPNGSGKSNVIDSLLFVFGFRAQRTRAKKVAVMIHDSEGHRDMDFCTVEIHFQKIIDKPDQKFEPVPNSQFYVTRTVYKDNSSNYKLNGKKVQFKAVEKKLKEEGIDLEHNRFLILQGEVEQIALMKPKAQTENDEGMLEYLEDIIGSSRLKQPIEQLALKIDELNELRNERLNRMKNAEKAKDELEGPKNEAIEYLELENKCAIIHSKMTQIKRLKEQQKLNTAIESFDESKRTEASIKEHLMTFEMKKKEKQAELGTLRKEYEKFEKEEQDWNKKMAELNANDKRDRAEIKRLKEEKTRIENQINTEKKKLQDANDKPAKCEKEIGRLREEIEDLEKKVIEFTKRKEDGMKQFDEETKELKKRRTKLELEKAKLAKIEDDARAKSDMAQQELDLFTENERKAKTKLREYENNRDDAVQQKEDRQKRIDAANRRLPDSQQKVDNAREQQAQLNTQEQNIRKQVEEKRTKTAEARASLQQQKTRSTVSDIVRALQKSKIDGIFGRLGDLGAIDEKYDVAISTTCGQLDNIVVDTIDTAQKCVEYLKKSNGGLATFIGLDKMQRFLPVMLKIPKILYTKGDRDQIGKERHDCPRMYDLIRVDDERVLPAFYFALRETLVTGKLDDATEISFSGRQRYRVVTLKGEVVDVSGTMTGGGNRVQKNRIGRKVAASPSGMNEDKVVKMEQDLRSLQQDLHAVQQDKQANAEELVRAERTLEEVEHTINTAKDDIKNLEDRVKLWIKNVAAQQKEVEKSAGSVDDAKAVQLRQKLDERKAALETAREAANEAEEKVNEVQAEMDEIEGRLVGLAAKSLKNSVKQLEETKKQITKEQADAKKAMRLVEKCEEKISNLENEHKEANERHQELVDGVKKLEDDALAVYDQLELATKNKEKAHTEAERVAVEVREIGSDEEEQKLRKELLDLDQQIKNQKVAIRDLEMKIKSLSDELKKLKLHDMTGLRSPKKKPLLIPIRPPIVDEQRVPNEEAESSRCETEDDEPQLRELTEEELSEINLDELNYELNLNKQNIANKKPNMAAIVEFRKKERKYLTCVHELEEATQRRNLHKDKYEELRKMRVNEFMTGFAEISIRLKEMYQTITIGGDAELELADSLDPFTEGIIFSVRPPKKSWKQISNLSGGEKTLSSLALVFALHHYKPTPLYVMDEIDAALDFRNVSIIANYIKDRTKNAQFIIISLRNNMFELADRLVGIYKTYNCTQHVVIDPAKISLGQPQPQFAARVANGNA